MTLLSDPDLTDPSAGRSRSRVGWVLTAVGIVAVAFWFVRNGVLEQLPVWAWTVGAVALGAWTLREVVRSPRVTTAAAAVMVVAGAAAVVPTRSLMLVAVIVGIVVLQSSIALPVWTGAVATLVALVEIAVVASIDGASVQFVLGTSGGLVLGVLVGFSRRQYRAAEAQARQAERDQQRAELLADRARAARDVHDVLAHSLGGLVLQLDAVEALLEAGRVDEAATRAGAARTLAADGLAEARRAVHALRDDGTSDGDRLGSAADVTDATRASGQDARQDPPVPHPDLHALVTAHRDFGGEVVVVGDLALADLDEAHRRVVVATTREALSNARRHAPGRPVSLSVIRDGDALDVVVANPLSGGGHGLVGIRERFAELGTDATVEAGRSEDEFVVAMHLPVAAASSDAAGRSDAVDDRGTHADRSAGPDA